MPADPQDSPNPGPSVSDLALRAQHALEDAPEYLFDLVEEVSKFVEVRDKVRGVAAHSIESNPHRWVSLGRTHLQEGLMALRRALEDNGDGGF